MDLSLILSGGKCLYKEGEEGRIQDLGESTKEVVSVSKAETSHQGHLRRMEEAGSGGHCMCRI